ncbi:hypothetical protein [Flavobacterium sp. 3-210]
MRKNFILILPILAFLVLQNYKNNSEVLKALSKISRKKVDISKSLKDYQLIDFFANDNNLCLTYTKDSKAYFSIIQESTITPVIEDTFNDYIYTRFSFADNIITNSNSLFNKNMINYNLLTKHKKNISLKNPFSFNMVKSFNGYLYFYGGSEGYFIYNLNQHTLVNKMEETSINPFSSNISLPLERTSILLSRSYEDELLLECYNENFVTWTKKIPQKNIYSQLRIINFNNFYIVYFDNKIIKLNKSDGKELTQFDLESDSFKIFVIDNTLYVIEKTASEKQIACKISILNTDLNKLIEKKSFNFDKDHDVYINVLDKTIIFSTDQTIKFYNLNTFEYKELKLNSSIFFENYIDDKTGDNLLLVNNQYVFY